MPDTYKATADMFSKQAAAYAASETHSMDADLMIMVKVASHSLSPVNDILILEGVLRVSAENLSFLMYVAYIVC